MTGQKISQTISRWHGYLCAIAVILISWIAWLGLVSLQHASAISGQVSATICDDSPPSLTISEPTNQSVSTTDQIQISGVALRTTQIDISVNGVLVQSVAIGHDPNFSTSMGLNDGENTLVLDAYFSCNQRHLSETLKVTVDLPETESNSQTNNMSNIAIPIDPARKPKTTKDRLRHNLGMSPTFSYERSIVRLIFSWLSAVLMIFSTIIFIYPLILDSLFAKFKPNTSCVKRRDIINRRHKLIRIVFLFITVILGVILQI